MSDIIIGISLIRMCDVTSTNNKHSILQFMKENNNKSKIIITTKKSTSNKSNNQSVKINT